ncbi:MAG: hypothetical protein PGN23_09585 [Sphingomonas adhaesiva]|uniref:hypothetical protein n=1 Tax=Sphingomonas adhaesiva TaxID=28212 RepID=UPI002FFB988A
MIAALLLAAALAQAPDAPMAPTSDTWEALPPVQFRRAELDTVALARFVRAEVEAGRCAAAVTDDAGSTRLRVPLAALVAPDGRVRRLVPAAIGCPTVEQFTVGVIGRLAADNVAEPWPEADRWLRTGLTYSWTTAAPAQAPR